jgi:hypothetical protein
MPPFTWVGDGFRCALPILRTCAPSTSLRAKRSNPSISVLSHGLLRCARNDVDTVSPSRGAFAPELCLSFRPQIKRAQGMPGAGWHPRSRVQIALVVAHTSIQVQPEQPGIPCAMGLRLIPSSPWRRIPFASIAGGLKVLRNPVGFLKTSAGLTPATGARTTRLCRPLFTPFVGARPSLMSKLTLRRRVARPACRGHRSPHPTSVTIAIRPSCGRGMAGVVRVIWGQREAEYF